MMDKWLIVGIVAACVSVMLSSISNYLYTIVYKGN